jgi:hypothetical protein
MTSTPPADKLNRYDSFARTLPTFQGFLQENFRISVLSIEPMWYNDDITLHFD